METSMTYEADLNLKATDLKLGLPGTDNHEKDEKQPSAVSFSLPSSKRSFSEFDDGTDSEKSDQNSSLATKVQVVGWPPVRAYRKNIFQTEKSDSDACAMYVKVSMDGAPYLRKIDLNLYKSYTELLKAVKHMFKYTIGVYSEIDWYNGSDYEPTYEDKDGDWMLVGDVPWQMFVTSCRRLRIMKCSEAKGLGYL